MAGCLRAASSFCACGPAACARVPASGRKARNIKAMPARMFLLESGCMGCLLVAKLLLWLERLSSKVLPSYFTGCQFLPASSVDHFRSSVAVTVALEALLATTATRSSDVGDGSVRQLLPSSVRKTMPERP